MSLFDHLRELRKRVIIALITVGAGAVVGWVIYPHVLSILEHPYCTVPDRYRYVGDDGKCVLVYQGVLDGFNTRLQVSLMTGAVLTAPVWLYQIWAFVAPGLRSAEKRYARWFVALSTGLFAAGAGLAYVILAKALTVLLTSGGSGTEAVLTVTKYLSFVEMMLVVFGSAFEIPLLIVMLNVAGVLRAQVLLKCQRIAIFGIFVFAAVATPTTDPISMCALAIPLVVLYEGAVLFAVVHDKRAMRRRIDLEAAQRIEDGIASDLS